MRFNMELEKMHKGLWPLGLAGLFAAILAGCHEVSPSSQSASQQRVASARASPGGPEKSREIVRGSLRFVEGYHAGMQTAAAQRKPILLFFTAGWCHYCDQLAADAFNDPAVVSLAEQFVCVLVDADREPTICQHFRVRAYPTIQFISARGQSLNRLVGKYPGREIARQMHVALASLAQRLHGSERTQ
jgi:thioredoxin-like negative regulator of GroEL